MKKPLVLTIIDGLGYSDVIEGNAWKQANTPFLDSLLKEYPNSILKASGESVGLPNGQMGNSEVGHLNIGAGKVVYTGLELISHSLKTGEFYKNKAFISAINHAKVNNSTLHIMGLLSPGGVHSQQEHLFSIIKLLKENSVDNATIHIFCDGRDVSPKSVKESLKQLLDILGSTPYKIGSIMGRLYAMDRDSMFEKTELAYEAICGRAINHFDDPISYIDSQYDKNLTDEFIEPAISNDSIKFLSNNDSIIFFNFRPDRARQLSHLFVGSKLYDFQPKNILNNIHLTIMMQYEGIEKSSVAFDSMEIEEPLGKVLSENGFKQLRIAETQKYAHVTFFMDGGKDIEYPNSSRILIESLKVDNFATCPEMSAKEITSSLISVLDRYDVVIMNYANPDMVGHTGDLSAAIKAVEIIDQEIRRLKTAVDNLGGVMLITADHGNCEIMLDKDGQPATKHTTSDVPFIFTDSSIKLVQHGDLTNVAPTILEYLGITKPISMLSKSLLIK